METKTEDRVQVLEKLLAEARAESDLQRRQLDRYANIIVSTRLIMGHELKKPATAINGYLDLVAEDMEEKGDYDALTFVEKATEECALLNDLNEYFIELLKIGAEREVVGHEAADIRALVREVVAYFRRGGEFDRDVTLDLDLPETQVDVDGNALRLVLMNLVENAFNYSQSGTPVRVEVEKGIDRRGGSERPLLKLRVIDEGLGIPEKYVGKVFHPFVRIHRDVAEGSGLGLTLVKSLVELNSGDVSIRSTPGRGTTVTVTLPIATRDDKVSVILP
jgi:signal transduction histidine kinase